ncbi:MAG TPA: phosphopentomutase [Thermoanaerobaculia bacterium]|jgi:phosphopentomutase|nr:phosphopentomutase [Thermoanaerobaculia bacterium]
MKTCALLVLDSVGIGQLPDADDYGDGGADTLGHLCELVQPRLPNLASLGLGWIRPLHCIEAPDTLAGSYGKMAEVSPGKDSTTGHWELAGLQLTEAFRTFPLGFPPELIRELEQRTGCATIGNKPASGTAIIKELGPEHEQTGSLIVYTSADPVLQIAAHEEILPLPRLYEICRIAFDLSVPLGISRVIARPFIGRYPDYVRTANRRDFTVPAPGPTILDILSAAGAPVTAIGKVGQIFSNRGISQSLSTHDNDEGLDILVRTLESRAGGLIFANLLDFDTLFGHRRDPEGYAKSLTSLDSRLPSVLQLLGDEDLLIITADHGNDPTFRGSDHTREFVPLLVSGPSLVKGRNLGTRESFADVAASVAEFFEVAWTGAGTSFLDLLR